MIRGYALTIEGCDYLFTTGGLPSITSSSPSALWPDPAEVADGYLAWPRNRITERAKPLDGDLETDGQRFTLHDAGHSTVNGKPLLTWLATRDPSNVTSTPLAADMSDGATSFTVGDGSALDTFPRVVWIEREAILCSGRVSNTVSVDTGGRGYLGTKAAAHTIDASRALFPEVFRDLPWITRRKVVLWEVDSAGAASAVWIGYAVRGPVLSRGDGEGAPYELPCDSLWLVQSQNPVGGELGNVRPVGFGRCGRDATANTGNADALAKVVFLITDGVTYPEPRIAAQVNGPFRTFEQLARALEEETLTRSTARGQRIDLQVQRSGTEARFNAEVVRGITGYPLFSMLVVFGGAESARTVSSPRSATRSGVTVSVRDVPRALYLAIEGDTGIILVTSLASLPSSWTPVTATDDTFTTVSTPVLRTVFDDDWYALLEVITATDGGALGPRVSGSFRLAPRKPGVVPHAQIITLRDPPPFQVIYRVRTDHWAYGLRRAVVPLCEDAQAEKDWDWSEVDTVARATAGLRVARDWTFAGKATLGSVVRECCLLHGCTPVTRSGRLALHAWGWPDATVIPAVSIDREDILGDPTWQSWVEGLANRLQVKSEALNLDASQSQSRARYGPGRQIAIELAGLDTQVSPIEDPNDFARTILGRLELWSEPLGVVRLTVAASYRTSLELGKEFVVSEWMLPDGAGDRGLTDARAFVVARELDLDAASLTVEAIAFKRLAYPYAPCLRVSSLVSGTEIEYATAYVNGASTYSGGNDGETFAVGDRVQFIVRDSTTLTTDDHTIDTIDTGTRRITFTSALSGTMQSAITGGSMVDMRFSAYATPVQAGQESWMFVGDDSTEVIAATADRARPIAP